LPPSARELSKMYSSDTPLDKIIFFAILISVVAWCVLRPVSNETETQLKNLKEVKR
jgi:hypothetical protein